MVSNSPLFVEESCRRHHPHQRDHDQDEQSRSADEEGIQPFTQ